RRPRTARAPPIASPGRRATGGRGGGSRSWVLGGPLPCPKTAGFVLEGAHDAAQLGQPLEAPYGGITRLRPAVEIVEDVLAVVGSHGDLVIGPALPPAPGFFGDNGGNQRHHVGVPGQMLVLEERAGDRAAVAPDVAQMQEM